MTMAQRISADALLPQCPEKSVGLALPAPISDRLDELVRLAEAAGERTTRKELVASLILAAPSSGEDVSVLLRTYRRSKARAARIAGSPETETIAVRSYGPGPRPRRRP